MAVEVVVVDAVWGTMILVGGDGKEGEEALEMFSWGFSPVLSVRNWSFICSASSSRTTATFFGFLFHPASPSHSDAVHPVRGQREDARPCCDSGELLDHGLVHRGEKYGLGGKDPRWVSCETAQVVGDSAAACRWRVQRRTTWDHRESPITGTAAENALHNSALRKQINHWH